jgi:anti-sigma factor (TIGR02949 family)
VTCRDVLEFLMAYLDGELPAHERMLFERHLAECPPCIDYLGTYREAIALGKAACEGSPACGEIPEELVKAILAARPSVGEGGTAGR